MNVARCAFLFYVKLRFVGGGGEGMRASGGELLKKLDQNFQLG
jgi:hypothetical protein